MKTRQPIQAKSTEVALKSILPESFKLVNDKTSNGYKYFNLLFGVEVDHAKTFLQEIYNNSFFPTMDFGVEDTLYEVYLSGLAHEQFINSSGIPIKITNNGSPGGTDEFWNGDPTRIIQVGIYNISGIIASGHATGLQYFRINPSGYGYFLISTDIDQSQYLNLSGSAWRVDVSTTGLILSYSGLWPGVGTQSYDIAGTDEILTPLGSGYLSKEYPYTRRIRDNSGVYWDIDAYEPYHGWVRDPFWGVVAKVDYLGDFYYDIEGKKTYYRSAFNNPYGSGNYTTEYLVLKNTPISGTLKVYDIDILDISGNAIEIPSSGKTLYRLKSDYMLAGTGLIAGQDPTFDPIYVGYDATVPNDWYKFGKIAGSGAASLLTTSWDYQRSGYYLDEGTMEFVEGSGEITNLIKINNPYSRYLVEYQYKIFNEAGYITSLEASRYIAFDTINPIYSITSNDNNAEIVSYEFTRDARYYNTELGIYDKAKFLTFDGWSIRPGSKLSLVKFNLPLLIGTGILNFQSFQTREECIGYTNEFVPLYFSSGIYTVLDCPFDNTVTSSGTCIEDDLSGSGNCLEWFNDGSNILFRSIVDDGYGKTIRHISNSGYFFINNVDFLADNTYFGFDFRLFQQSNITLMELSQPSYSGYIKVEIIDTGMLQITSNGSTIQSRYRFSFDGALKGLIIGVTPDQNFTDNLVYSIYIKDQGSYVKQSVFVRDTDDIAVSGTYLRVAQNSTLDISNFKIWYEDSTWQV